MDELVRKLEGIKDMAEARIAGYNAGLKRALELIGEDRPEIDEDGEGGAALDYEAIGYNIAVSELRTRIQAELEEK